MLCAALRRVHGNSSCPAPLPVLGQRLCLCATFYFATGVASFPRSGQHFAGKQAASSKQPGSTSYSNEFSGPASSFCLPICLLTNSLSLWSRGSGIGRGMLRGKLLLFWLSRLQLPGHAFGLATAWLGPGLCCLLAAFATSSSSSSSLTFRCCFCIWQLLLAFFFLCL